MGIWAFLCIFYQLTLGFGTMALAQTDVSVSRADPRGMFVGCVRSISECRDSCPTHLFTAVYLDPVCRHDEFQLDVGCYCRDIQPPSKE